MLSETRVARAQVSLTDKLVVSIYDISSSGSFTLKNTFNGGPTVKDQKPGIVRLTNGSFATAAALSVAIPAVFAYNIFASRLNKIEGQLESFGSELIALMVREGMI